MPDVGSNKVQLGCGTLIIIALIVMFLSGGNRVDDLKKNVQELILLLSKLLLQIHHTQIEDHTDIPCEPILSVEAD